MAQNWLLLTILAVNVLGALSAISITGRENVTVKFAFPAVLRCVVFLEDRVHIAPVRWIRANGVEIDQTRYNPIEGTLPFSSVQFSDAGGYICNATSGPDSATATLYLTVLDEIDFLSKPQNVEVSGINTRAVFDCNTTNFNTDATYSWFNDSNPQPIPLGGAAAVLVTGQRLIILRVQIYDIGSYTCRITRTTGGGVTQMINSTVSLSVTGYGPPTTGLSVGSEHAISIVDFQTDGDDRDELNCNIDSLLPPTYVWTRNGAIITSESTDDGVFARAGTDVIVFKYATSSDSGVYNCTATNKLGSAWRAYNVRVNERDDIIWIRWWMILIYCLIFLLFLLCLLVMLIYVLCTGGYAFGGSKRKATEDTTVLFDNATAFDTSGMATVNAYDQFKAAETGSQTWEQQFSGEDVEEGSMVSFPADDPDNN